MVWQSSVCLVMGYHKQPQQRVPIRHGGQQKAISQEFVDKNALWIAVCPVETDSSCLGSTDDIEAAIDLSKRVEIL